ncbi:MAG: hypothetical protein AAGK37_12720 [Pseudomonadota bacterium]
MGSVTLSKTVLRAGVWYGLARRQGATDGTAPQLSAWHLEKKLDGFEVSSTPVGGQWEVRLPISTELLSDGVQTILIRDDETGEKVDTLTLIAGEPLGQDIRAELDLLRAELDMLKKAFRQHCAETGG